MEWKNVSVEDLPEIASQLLEKAGDRRKWMIQGEMGAGKTTLVKALCEALQSNEAANSPTYSIVNEYSGIWKEEPVKIHHIDLYRLNTIEESLDIGIEEYLDDQSYCFIEWPDLIRPLWPPEALEIKIDILPDSLRNILFL